MSFVGRNRSPVRYYADTRGNMRELIEHAIRVVGESTAYGRVQG
jgi:hypothetical protein